MGDYWSIDEAESESDELDTEWRPIVGIEMPQAFDGTKLTFTGRSISDTLGPITIEGEAYEVAAAAGDRVTLNPFRLRAWRYVTVTSAAPESAKRAIQPIYADKGSC